MNSFPSDLDIPKTAKIKPIKDVALKLGVHEDLIEPFGRYKAKLPLSLIDEQKVRQHHLILVTAVTPTLAGEGKTTMTIGLADALNKLGKKAIAVLREPSLGPVFGMKGGATGGGNSQLYPVEDINMHFTGDFSAIERANNLLSAIIDNELHHHGGSDLDPLTITWKRVMDMNDRALRDIIVGLGGAANGVPRQDGFNITPASEIMAILCLAENMTDLKRRLGNIYIGKNHSNQPVFARDLKVVGAMAALLKDAIKPNLVQSIEGNAAILHGGPFASIAQGTNSIIATKMGLTLGDYVVTEAGFAADLGAEKFFDIKCVEGGLNPEAVVIVTTIRALRHHGGCKKSELMAPSVSYVSKGLSNLDKHVENVLKFNLHPVVMINKFPDDTIEEIQFVKDHCASYGVKAILSTAFADGGAGSQEVAEEVLGVIERKVSHFQPLYQRSISIEDKIHRIATEMYGASGVEYSQKAKSDLKLMYELGFGEMAVCMAKTPKSLSDDERKVGRPRDFVVTVREIEIAAGAGFVVPILGDIMRMPGLPLNPSAYKIDIDADGNITGIT